MTQFGMIVERLSSAEEFLLLTTHLRSSEPFRANILGSVATAVATGNLTYESCLWWIVKDIKGQVVGAAMRTSPHVMVLSPMPEESAEVLGHEVSIYDDDLPGVSGPSEVVRIFADAYKQSGSNGSVRPAQLESKILLYVLNQLAIPNIGGVMQSATEDDFELLLKWHLAFKDEAHVLMPDPELSIHAGLKRNAFRFWVVNQEIVSMAGQAPLVETPSGAVARIGPVYTPPEYRRNGYAGVLTAMFSKELLNLGAKVMLYTDAANPTSNSIYQKIGYELVDENQKIEFLAVDA